MNTSRHSSLEARSTAADGAELKVNTYDRAAGTLVALLIVIGVAVLLLLTVWLTARLVFDKPPSEIVRFVYAGDSPDDVGLDGELEEPGLEDLEDVNEASIEAALIAVTDVVTSQAAALEALERDSPGNANGLPKDDPREPGDTKGWDPRVIPPWQRWEIRFNASDIETYARQLDFFGIELGALGGGSPNVQYAHHLTKPKPDCRSGAPQDEERMYMTWQDRDGPMADLDRQLLGRAGISSDRRVVLQFYPPEVEKQLLLLEAAEAGDRKPPEFLKTTFGVRSAGNGYEFFVVDQMFRPPPVAP